MSTAALVTLCLGTLVIIGALAAFSIGRRAVPREAIAHRVALLHAVLFERVAMRRPPDFIVGDHRDPWLLRWWLLPRNPLCNVYLHCFMRSDDSRALHDHPWPSLSLALEGRMVEHTVDQDGAEQLLQIEAGTWRWRGPWFKHWLELLPAHQVDGALGAPHESALRAPCWTLLLVGPRIRAWGFHCPQGWVPWQRFTDTTAGQSVTGRGCD